MSPPKRLSLRLGRAHGLYVPPDCQAGTGDVVAFQGLGVCVEVKPTGDVTQIRVEATEIALLDAPATLIGWQLSDDGGS